MVRRKQPQPQTQEKPQQQLQKPETPTQPLQQQKAEQAPAEPAEAAAAEVTATGITGDCGGGSRKRKAAMMEQDGASAGLSGSSSSLAVET